MLLALLFVLACGGDDLYIGDTDTDADTGDTGDTGDTDTDTDTDAGSDRDGDGYPAGEDCDDARADVNPGVAADVCNGRDDDCDGTVDEDPDLSWYTDADRDGFGAAGTEAVFVACEATNAGYASNRSDCDDRDDTTFPGADEICDGADNDCDGSIDDGAGVTDWYPDADGDGYGDSRATPYAGCDPGDGSVPNAGDCDDRDASTYLGAPDVCDRADNDCNGSADDDPSHYETFYRDSDGDGAGTSDLVYGCSAETAGGAENDWDCDDADATEPIFVSTTGSSRGTGRVDSPLSSIQLAIDNADVCVRVDAGTYYEDLDFGGRDVDVASLDGSSATTIVGTGGAPVATFASGESNDAALRGFTLTGGSGRLESSNSTGYMTYYYYRYAYGGGLYVSYAAPTLEDLVVVDNAVYDDTYSTYSSGGYTYYYIYSGQGGGLYNIGGSPILTDVSFVGNSGYLGAAIYDDYGVIDGIQVRLQENAGRYATYYAYRATHTWENLIVNADSSGYAWAGIYLESATVDITNATLVDLDFGISAYASSVSLESATINGNTYGVYDLGDGAGSWSLSYTNVYGNGYDYANVPDFTGYAGNISVDPGFTSFSDDGDADADDLSLTAASALRNAGNPSSSRNDADGTRNDIGAYGGPDGAGW